MFSCCAAVGDVTARLPLLGLAPTGQVSQLAYAQLSLETTVGAKPAAATGSRMKASVCESFA